MADNESTEHLTVDETEDNGCLNKLKNILKKKLERDVASKNKNIFFIFNSKANCIKIFVFCISHTN